MGSPDLLLALLKTQQDRVYNLCFQVLRHAEDAEDAAQKVLLKLVEGLGALPDAAALRRWLYRVCVTTALDVRTERSRRRAREREVALMNPIQSAPASDGEGRARCREQFSEPLDRRFAPVRMASAGSGRGPVSGPDSLSGEH